MRDAIARPPRQRGRTPAREHLDGSSAERATLPSGWRDGDSRAAVRSSRCSQTALELSWLFAPGAAACGLRRTLLRSPGSPGIPAAGEGFAGKRATQQEGRTSPFTILHAVGVVYPKRRVLVWTSTASVGRLRMCSERVGRIQFVTRRCRTHACMKPGYCVARDAGIEVGWSLVPRARHTVGPGVPRAPRIATPARPVNASCRLRSCGLHASAARSGGQEWKSCIAGAPGWMSTRGA